MDPNITEHERATALKYCKEHLNGVWSDVHPNKVTICRLSGGMSNHLYYCALLETVKTYEDEPREVLLRLYGPSHSDTELQLEIFNKLAKESLGPSLYGTFDGGRLEEYIPSNPLRWEEMVTDQVSAVVARKIAAIHKLNIKSMNRESNWLLDKLNQMNQFIVMSNKSPAKFGGDVLESTRAIASQLRDIDFKPEIEHLASLLLKQNAPLVFSHNDLHQNNIILMHHQQDIDKDQSRIDLNDRIVLIDFEYSSYNYRLFDLANHLSEWCFDYCGAEYPYFSAFAERFPSREKQRQFLAHYASQFGANYSDNSLNSNGHSQAQDLSEPELMEKIDSYYDEMQPLLMASNLLWALWAIESAYTSKIKFGYWEMAKCKWEIYLLCKKRYETNYGRGVVQSARM